MSFHIKYFHFFLYFSWIFFNSFSSEINHFHQKENETQKNSDSALILRYIPFKTYSYISTYLCPNKDFIIEHTENLVSASVSPHNQGITCTINGKQAKFRIPHAGQYVVYLNNFKVCLFVEEPEKLPENFINIVKDKRVDSTGVQDETKRIQMAIDEIAGTGKTLLFPAGTYSVSQLRICNKKNVKIHLCKGAVLRARISDSDPFSVSDLFGKSEKSVREPGKVAGIARGFIVIYNSRNIRISGYGMIDGNGYAQRVLVTQKWNKDSQGRHRNLLIVDSENIHVEGIMSVDPGSWNIHPIMCRQVTFRNIKLMNELEYAPIQNNPFNIDHNKVNTDGFDPDSSSDILIENCFGYCSDDNVAIKASQYNNRLGKVNKITIRGCVFLTQKSSLKVGTETATVPMHNILFENNDVIEADRAIAVYNYDGAIMKNIQYLNNRVERNFPDIKQALLYIELKKRTPTSNIGQAQIEIRKLQVLEPFPKNSYIIYRDGTNPTNLSVTFSEISIKGVPINDTKNGRINILYPLSATTAPIIKFE